MMRSVINDARLESIAGAPLVYRDTSGATTFPALTLPVSAYFVAKGPLNNSGSSVIGGVGSWMSGLYLSSGYASTQMRTMLGTSDTSLVVPGYNSATSRVFALTASGTQAQVQASMTERGASRTIVGTLGLTSLNVSSAGLAAVLFNADHTPEQSARIMDWLARRYSIPTSL